MPASFELASIIVSTYNRPDALEKVLLGLDQQTIDAFEVVVADDGSSEETARTIDRLRDRVDYRLKHAWQEDEGFRLARSRNVAVLQAEGDYLIFLDGDCIPLRDFVEGHRWLAEPGWFVKGSRVHMTEKFTARILAEDVPVKSWPPWRWAVAKFRGESARFTPFFRFRTQLFRKVKSREWRGAKGCNLGMWREDFLRVDGWDETFIAWGREDSDLAARLINAGVGRKEGRYVIPILHLSHPWEDKSALDAADVRLREVIEKGITRPRSGISSHKLGADH